jgi:hypothetical protein
LLTSRIERSEESAQRCSLFSVGTYWMEERGGSAPLWAFWRRDEFLPLLGSRLYSQDGSYYTDLTISARFRVKKGKSVPLQAWSGPEDSRKWRFPDFMTAAQDGGMVVSLTHRPSLPPGNTPGTHFCQRLSRPQGRSATGRIISMKKFNDTIGNRTRDLPRGWDSQISRQSAHRSLLPSQEIFLVLISVRSCVDPRTIGRPEGLCQWKIQITSSGIEPANFRLIAKCLV